MTSLGLAVALVATLVKDLPPPVQAVLWVVAVLSAIVGLWSLSRAAGSVRRARRARHAKEAAFGDENFTSAGLTWKAIGSDGDGRCVLQIRQVGTELPQPLYLRVKSSSELRHGYASFYPDSRFLDKKVGDPIEAELRGREALFTVREPKLHGPAMLSIIVVGNPGELVSVESVERRRSS